RRTDDYDSPVASGHVPDTYTSTDGFSVGASHIGDNGYIGVSGGRMTSEYGIPAAEERLFIDMRQTRFNMAGSWHDLSFEGGWSDYTHDEVAHTTGDIGSTFKNKEWEARAEYLHEGIVGNLGAVGVQVSGRNLRASGEGGELLSPAESATWAGFAFEELTLRPALDLQLGARLEQVEHKGFGVVPSRFDGATLRQPIDDFGTATKRDFTLLSGSAALIKELSETRSLTGAVQYAQRAPAVPELFSKGPHEATETFEIGNPHLSQERAVSVELGVADTDFSLTAFYTRFDGFIFKDFTGFVCGEAFETCGDEGAAGVEDELTQIAFAQADATFYGLEAEGTLWLGTVHGFQIGAEGRFDLVRAKLDRGGNVPRIPPMRLGAGLVAEGQAVVARVFLNHVFAQKRLGVNETPTEGYDDLSAQIFWQPAQLSNLTLGVAARNLLDERARNHVSFKKQDIVLPGRQFRIFMRGHF
ncbi:MAG: TonB-dependent receptor domain-containing protein, partial [Alphaproteobacteria bacterium]